MKIRAGRATWRRRFSLHENARDGWMNFAGKARSHLPENAHLDQVPGIVNIPRRAKRLRFRVGHFRMHLSALALGATVACSMIMAIASTARDGTAQTAPAEDKLPWK